MPLETIGERVERIRTQIARGEYVVDLDRLAARMVDDEAVRSMAEIASSLDGARR